MLLPVLLCGYLLYDSMFSQTQVPAECPGAISTATARRPDAAQASIARPDAGTVQNVTRVKQRYRAILLVIACHESSLSRLQKKIYEAYSTAEPDVKVMFVYGGGCGMTSGCTKSHDFLFENLLDSYPVKIHKTIEALKIIEENYEYDFLVRSNLSTFWVLRALLEHLKALPSHFCYEGDGPLRYHSSLGSWLYQSGTDTIINHYMVQKFLREVALLPMDHIIYQVCEDQAMGYILFHKMNSLLIYSNMHFMEHLTDIIPQHLEAEIRDAEMRQQTHFRVKSRVKRHEIDPWVLRGLLKHYYNKTIDEDNAPPPCPVSTKAQPIVK